MSRRSLRIALCLAGALIIAVAVYAFTASNTVPATAAGSGSAAISGYTVSSVDYTLNSGTPTNIDEVSFTLSPTAADTVQVQLASGGAFYECINTSGSVSCDTTSPQATVAAATQLTVLAVD
jgi:hypothetical protein